MILTSSLVIVGETGHLTSRIIPQDFIISGETIFLVKNRLARSSSLLVKFFEFSVPAPYLVLLHWRILISFFASYAFSRLHCTRLNKKHLEAFDGAKLH